LASTVFIPLFAWWMSLWGWRQALWGLAALQLLVCMPLHAWLLAGAHSSPGRPTATPSAAPKHWFNSALRRRFRSAESGADVPPQALPQSPLSVHAHLRHAPFWLLGLFMVLMMSVTSALPAHMIALLQEAGLSPTWVIAVPAAIGVIQVVGRLVLFVFEHHWDVHTANRWIPGLIPVGLLALLLGSFHPLGALVFVVFFGLGNGMSTIVKGTAMAQYVSREHVGQLNGLMGIPIAIARAAAPLAVGLLWSPALGYKLALGWLLLASVMATAALWVAQRQALKRRH
jgi:predicted MFS family arabinose efflux permease